MNLKGPLKHVSTFDLKTQKDDDIHLIEIESNKKIAEKSVENNTNLSLLTKLLDNEMLKSKFIFTSSKTPNKNKNNFKRQKTSFS